MDKEIVVYMYSGILLRCWCFGHEAVGLQESGAVVADRGRRELGRWETRRCRRLSLLIFLPFVYLEIFGCIIYSYF